MPDSLKTACVPYDHSVLPLLQKNAWMLAAPSHCPSAAQRFQSTQVTLSLGDTDSGHAALKYSCGHCHLRKVRVREVQNAMACRAANRSLPFCNVQHRNRAWTICPTWLALDALVIALRQFEAVPRLEGCTNASWLTKDRFTWTNPVHSLPITFHPFIVPGAIACFALRKGRIEVTSVLPLSRARSVNPFADRLS
jgi:hypothetical protein